MRCLQPQLIVSLNAGKLEENAYNEIRQARAHCIYNEFGPKCGYISQGGGVKNSLFIVSP